MFSLSDFPARSAIVEFEPGEVFRDVGEPQLRPPDRKSTGGKPFGFRFRFCQEGRMVVGHPIAAEQIESGWR